MAIIHKYKKIILVLAIMAAVFCILLSWSDAVAEIKSLAAIGQSEVISKVPTVEKVKPSGENLRGLYLTAYSAGSTKKLDQVIALVSSTELNGLVIDIKDYSGYVLYDSKLPIVNDLKMKDVRVKNWPGIIEKLKANNIYVVARLSVFQDPLLAERKKDWALKSKSGGLWRDRKGLAWVDPTNKEVWKYIVSIAKEAADLGFDEINLDYIRFPTDGNLANVVYSNGDKKRYEVISEFFSYFSKQVEDKPVVISADLFGLTSDRKGEEDMNIGQRMDDAVKYFDYVMPMVYPSHYPSGYLRFANPAAHPYEVVNFAIKNSVKKAEGQRAKIRSWIQAFNMGAVYDGEKIRAQIKATADAGADGWVLWNAANRYTSAGLEKE